MGHAQAVKSLLDENRFDEAITLHRAFTHTSKFKAKYLISLLVHECPVCREHRISFSVKERKGNEWKLLPETVYNGATSEVLQV
ncbi:MAG: hypothetical protein LBV12_10130 [Puniceicoccales bacterium]|jgi:hypothetical protein|nr:hypothetical protein [Puniceicoccales bacterium]